MKKNSEGFAQPMTSMDYFFSDGIESRKIIAAERCAAAATQMRQNDAVTLIFIKSGVGTIEVNGDTLELKRGVLMALSDYHTYKLLPSTESVIHYVECQFDYMIFLYFVSSPYFKFRVPGFGARPVYAVTDEYGAETAERLCDHLISSLSRSKKAEREILQVMELFGMTIKSAVRYPRESGVGEK